MEIPWVELRNCNGGVVAEVGAILDCVRGPAIRNREHIITHPYKLRGYIPSGLDSVETELVVRENCPRVAGVGDVPDYVQDKGHWFYRQILQSTQQYSKSHQLGKNMLGSHGKGQKAREEGLGNHDGDEG